jgi:hypothetical protein
MDSLDRILLTDEVLVPSERFAASVMQQVRASAPLVRPCRFPWKVAVRGLIALCAATAALVGAALAGWRLLPRTIEPQALSRAMIDASVTPLAFALLAILASLALTRLCLLVTE